MRKVVGLYIPARLRWDKSSHGCFWKDSLSHRGRLILTLRHARTMNTPLLAKSMAFFRQYIAPLLIVLIFLVALGFITARNFLPAELTQPAPVGTLLLPHAFNR
jgi:hypothetical protein